MFPTATKATVDFNVLVNPCIVTSFLAPARYYWVYQAGRIENYIFNFLQEPCEYKETFSARL